MTTTNEHTEREELIRKLNAIVDKYFTREVNPYGSPPFEMYVTEEGEVLQNAGALLEAQPAEQANGREAVELGSEWTPCMKLPVVVHVRKQRPGEQHVSTREGITPIKPDDLIMRGVAGEEYPIGRELFERTYTLDTTPPAQPAREWVGLDEEKAEALIEDLAEWSRYVDEDHAHQTLEKHVRDVLEKHGIKEKQ